MKLLLIPHISTKEDIYKESDFIVWKQFIESWGDDAFCYVLLNEGAVISEELKLPNVEYIRLGEWFPSDSSQMMVSDKIYGLFNPINGKYQVDAILTSKVCLAPSLKRMFSYTDNIRIPVYVLDQWVPAGVSNNLSIDLRLRSLAYSECPTFFLTEREFGLAKDFSSKFLSSKAMSDFHRNSVVRSQGIHAKRIFDYSQSVEKFDKFTFVFSARFNPNKQWDKVLEVYEDIFRMGRDVQIKAVSTLNEAALPDNLEQRFSKVEFIPTQTFTGYVDLISRSHVAVSMSVDEGFAAGWAEHICTGYPVVLPNKDWAISLVGDSDYPYLYSSEIELIAMLRWIVDNYDEAKSKMTKYVEYFVQRHDVKIASQEILNLVKDTHGGTWMVYDSWETKWRATLDQMPDTFLFEEFLDVARKDYGAKYGTFHPAYLKIVRAYRNIYKWLFQNTKVLHDSEMRFQRVS